MKRALAHAAAPTALTLRAYQVGFGDCFLLTFHYAGFDRHVLIDCGSSAFPRGRAGAKKPPLLRVAEDIREQCGGKLHAVIVSHRHRDHLGGFETRKDGRGPGDILRALDPDVVVLPWTEDPALPEGPARAYAAALGDMQRVAESVLTEVTRMRAGAVPRGVLQQLEFLAAGNVRMASAEKNLAALGKRRVYAQHGTSLGLEKLLPGVALRVLGPPPLNGADAARVQRAVDEAEYWRLQASAAPGGASRRPRPLFRGAVDLKKQAPPPDARWFIPRVRALRAESLLELLRTIDAAINETSLILLVDAGSKRLLFPGDAQLDSWSYALKEAKNAPEARKLLAEVDLYKVGHHGGKAATPKALWSLFRHKGGPQTAQRLATVLSTLSGKHGRDERGTEVPRSRLVKELERHSRLLTTQEVRGRALREDLRIVL